MTTLAALTHPTDEPCTRYRVLLYLPYLEKLGIKVYVIPWPGGRKSQKEILESIGQWDCVLLQRRLPDLRTIRAIRKRCRRLVYDFDDAIVYRDSTRGSPWLLLDKWLRFRSLLRACDQVTAGNQYLWNLAAAVAGPDKVVPLPTTVDLGLYRSAVSPVKDSKKRQRIRLGWIGMGSTVPYLERLKGPLEALFSANPEWVLQAITDQKPRLGSVPVEWTPWRAETEIVQLKHLDVGLAPLPDDRWTRGKCGLRLIQYLAAGVPAVSSPVGTQRLITEAGASRQAQRASDWIREIHFLVSNPGETQKMLRKGEQLLESNFKTEKLSRVAASAWTGLRIEQGQ